MFASRSPTRRSGCTRRRSCPHDTQRPRGIRQTTGTLALNCARPGRRRNKREARGGRPRGHGEANGRCGAGPTLVGAIEDEARLLCACRQSLPKLPRDQKRQITKSSLADCCCHLPCNDCNARRTSGRLSQSSMGRIVSSLRSTPGIQLRLGVLLGSIVTPLPTPLPVTAVRMFTVYSARRQQANDAPHGIGNCCLHRRSSRH